MALIGKRVFARNDGARGTTAILQSHPDSQAHLHGLAACFARALLHRAALIETRAQGRPGAGGTRDPCATRCTRGGPQVMPVARPSLRGGLRLASCSPRGALHYCPRRPHGWLMCTPGRAGHITTGLDDSNRSSGPHDFAVRARPRWDFECWRVLTPEAMRRRCRRRVVCTNAIAHGKAALQR